MSTAEPDETVSTTAARDRFADILNRAAYGKERVVMTRRGRPLVAVVPRSRTSGRLEALEDERDAEEVRRRREAWERAGRPSVSIEDVAARRGVDLAAADED